MSETDLSSRRCEACAPGTPTLERQRVEELLPRVAGWQLTDDGKGLRFERRMKGFAEALDFVNRVGAIAEEEDHHPDIRIFSYRNVALDLSTHSIGGLSENDFIMAAKINKLLE
jgi:4a-hydroxytetrahydrobiopterin dehydratase